MPSPGRSRGGSSSRGGGRRTPFQAIEHYRKKVVSETIEGYCSGRWVALTDGRRWIRYLGGRPLTLARGSLLPLMERTGMRSVYCTASKYSRMREREDVMDLSEISAFTPFWDIDNEFQSWDGTIEAARMVVEELRSLGIKRSVYVVWSGNGAHVRVCEESLPGKSPLDEAWALASLVAMRVEPKIVDLVEDYPRLKVQNLVRPHILFTAPLSLHRTEERVAIPLRPESLSSFDPSWVRPEDPVFDEDWNRCLEGEAEEAVARAIEIVGGYPPTRRRRRKTRRIEDMLEGFI